MFQTGDIVVHPVHGVGTITDISTRGVAGESLLYYVIDVLSSKMTLLVPVDRAAGIGLHKAPGKAEVEEALSIVASRAEGLSDDSKERRARLSCAVNSGDVLRLAGAYRDLAGYGHQRRLSFDDSRLLERMRCLLGAQVALAQGIGPGEASTLVRRMSEGKSKMDMTWDARAK